MADIQYWKDAIVGEIETVRNLVQVAQNTSDDLERSASLEKAEKGLRSTKSNTRSFKMEIRLVFDHNERSKYERELTNFEQSISQLTAEIKNLRSGGARSQLFMGANAGEGTSLNEDPVAAGDAVLDGASRLQDKTGQSLGNTKQMIADSKMVASSTVEALKQQREQITNIEGDVLRVKDNLNRADKLIKNFGKRMATDKLIQCFACVNIMLVVGVVLYLVIKGGKDDDENRNAPESPVESRQLKGLY